MSVVSTEVKLILNPSTFASVEFKYRLMRSVTISNFWITNAPFTHFKNNVYHSM